MQWIKYKGYKEKLSTKQEREWMDKDMAAKWLQNYDKVNKVTKTKVSKSKNKKNIPDLPMFEDGDTSGPPPWE